MILANYALCLGQAQRVREGVDICRRAFESGSRHPEISLRLAQLYLLAGSKRLAIAQVERGLAISPHFAELQRLRAEIGIRRPPPIPFLPRGSAVNVGLARLLRRRRTGSGSAAQA